MGPTIVGIAMDLVLLGAEVPLLLIVSQLFQLEASWKL